MNRSAARKQASEAQRSALLDEVAVGEAKPAECLNELLESASSPRQRIGVELDDHSNRRIAPNKLLHAKQRLLFGALDVHLDQGHGRPPQLAEECIQRYRLDGDGLVP